MANTKKLIQAAAGAAGGAAALNVEDVFSTYLYEGNFSTQTITNGIDLDGEGGLVWLKSREDTKSHFLYDTERGTSSGHLTTNSTNAQYGASSGLSAFNSNGFSLAAWNDMNGSGLDYASWTFRKAPKFFTCLTYTGDGTSSRSISHNLGSSVGSIIIKRTDTTSNWPVWHRSTGDNYRAGYLNLTNAGGSTTTMVLSTSSSAFTVGNNTAVNASGGTYVAYLFAHNDGDGEFGDGTQDIIKCGSYSINASDHVEDLGFEPQWVMTKSTNIAGSWIMVDNMRGMGVDRVANQDQVLRANITNAEATNNGPVITPTGFVWPYDGGNAATNGEQGIYIAIRRGPMAVPESATDVFDIAFRGTPETAPPTFNSGFVTDFAIWANTGTAPNEMNYRLSQNVTLDVDATTTQHSQSSRSFDYMDGFGDFTGTNTSQLSWMWKRAPNFCDVVCYDGTGSARTINHNLGVAPEMIWIKNRENAFNWIVYHSGIDVNSDGAPETDYIILDSTAAAGDSAGFWNDTAPTASNFSLGSSSAVNQSGQAHVAFLFASLDGVSKVGSYTGNGSSQTIDCGFTSGARFVLIKRTDSTGDWYVWDTERGIVAANDPHLSLNTTAAQVTTDDSIDPVSSGFAVNQVSATNINVSSATYIFYAIA